jgi:membrane dipeptidase
VAEQGGQFAAILHVTGAPLNNSLSHLHTLHQIGVRSMHPFNDDPGVGGDCDLNPRVGLSAWGGRIIDEMQRLGMIVDLSHAGDITTRQVLRRVKGPVIDSHSNCRALRNVPRNRTDAQLKAIAATGGVVGVHFGAGFIEDCSAQVDSAERKKLMGEFHRTLDRMERECKDPWQFMARRYEGAAWSIAVGGSRRDSYTPIRASLNRLVDHIEHMAEVMGIDHVGIGTDYSLGGICKEVEQAQHLPRLTEALLERGFTAGETKKILGGNFYRVFRQVLPKGANG